VQGFLKTSNKVSVGEIDNLLQHAVSFHRAGRLKASERACNDVLELDPGNSHALNLLGLVYAGQGAFERAIEYFSRARDSDPSNNLIVVNLAKAMKANGNIDGAIACYRQALDREPRFDAARLELGQALFLYGDNDGAAACYRQVIANDPANAQAYKCWADMLSGANQPFEAIDCYQHALQIVADDVYCHKRLGDIYQALDMLNESAASYQAALKIIPGSAELHLLLGGVRFRQYNYDEARHCFNQAIAIKPDFFGAFNNLGNLYLAMRQPDKAVDCYRRAIALNPYFAMAYNNLGRSLRVLGDFDAAVTSYRKALELEPDLVPAHFNLATTVRHREYDSDMQAMERVIEKNGPDNVANIELLFALGKSYEDIGNTEKSIDYFLSANAAYRRQIRFDIKQVVREFATISSIFGRHLFEKNQGSGYESELPVFIVGMPRSGTSLVEQILASHPQVYGAGELDDLKRILYREMPVETRAPFPDCVNDLGNSDFRDIGLRYVQGLKQWSSSATRITDKMPHNFLFVGMIRLILPQARIIHCVRDPVDTCLSCFIHYFASESFGFCYDLAELGEYFRLYAQLMDHWRDVLPDAMLDVRYEDIINDQEGQTRRLLEYCGLDWNDQCLDFHETERPVITASTEQVRQPIYASSVRKWATVEDRLQPLLEALNSN